MIILSFRYYQLSKEELIHKLEPNEAYSNNSKDIVSQIQSLSYNLAESGYQTIEINNSTLTKSDSILNNLGKLNKSNLSGTFANGYKFTQESVNFLISSKDFFDRNFRPRNSINKDLSNKYYMTFSSDQEVVINFLLDRILKSTTLKRIISENRVIDMGRIELGIIENSSMQSLQAQYPYIIYTENDRTKIIHFGKGFYRDNFFKYQGDESALQFGKSKIALFLKVKINIKYDTIYYRDYSGDKPSEIDAEQPL
ncbi:MAG: hypothetical protein WBA74_01950 [Cyclobacteriaceae bacterium]